MTLTLPYSDDLIKCVEAQDTDLLRGVKAISQILNPDGAMSFVDQRLDDLAAAIDARGVTVDNVLKVFVDDGFKGAEQDEFHEYRNSDIANVLDERKGIPITNTTIIIAVCDRLGLPSRGVNFPGMFLAQIESSIIEPVHFDIMDYDSLKYVLEKRQIAVPDKPAIASNQEILTRMFNNLESIALLKNELVKCMEFLDYMQLVTPNYWFTHFERAKVWSMMDDMHSSQSELEIAHSLTDDEEVIRMIEHQMKQMPLSHRDDVKN